MSSEKTTMRISMSVGPDDIERMDKFSAFAAKNWGFYLAAGIISVLLGAVIISFRVQTVFVLVVLAAIWFIFNGIAQLAGSAQITLSKWIYIVGGIISILAGILALFWPGITAFVFAIIFGWVLVIWGIVDIIGSFIGPKQRWWWLYLVRGIVSAVLGFLALTHPLVTLEVLVIILGIEAFAFGIIEIVSSFQMRHADKTWSATKKQIGI